MWVPCDFAMKDRMTVNNFAKKLGFKNGKAYGFKGHLRMLERAGAVQVKQAGYYGDSMHHPRIVVITNLEAIQWHFKMPGLLETKQMPIWKRVPRCRHREFSQVCSFDVRFIGEKVFRKVVLKCGFCDFCLLGIEVDGVMKQARPF